MNVFDLWSENIICWEQKQTFLSDGRIFAVCWAFNAKTKQNHPNYYTFSSDLDDSYEQAFQSPLRGQTCTPIGLENNYVLCVYRRLDKKGLWGHLARIEGDKWIPVSEKLVWGGDVDAIAGGVDSSITHQKIFNSVFQTLSSFPMEIYSWFSGASKMAYPIFAGIG